MVSAGDFRNGLTIKYENQIYVILEFQHVKPGKGAAFVRTKIKKNLKKTGSVIEKTFRPSEKKCQKRISKERICNIYIMTENYITSWMLKHTTR